MPSRTALVLIACLCRAGALAAQAHMSLDEAARWLATDGTELAVSSTDETATSNLQRITFKSTATLALQACRLTIVVTDNSGVSGFTTTMQVPLKEVDVGGLQVVSRAQGYHDFVYIPGQYFVSIPARVPATYPFLTISSRGELRSYLAAIPARDADAARRIAAVLQRATELCGVPP